MIHASLVAQRLNAVTENLETQFAVWEQNVSLSVLQTPMSLPLNSLVLNLKNESDQIIASINRSRDYIVKWDILADCLDDIGIDVTKNKDNVLIDEPDHVSADAFLVQIANRYLEVLKFYHSMQQSSDRYYTLTHTVDYYMRLRGSVWKYTVVPLQLCQNGLNKVQLKTMFTAKTLKLDALINVKDFVSIPTKLANFYIDDKLRHLRSNMDKLLINSGHEILRFEKNLIDNDICSAVTSCYGDGYVTDSVIDDIKDNIFKMCQDSQNKSQLDAQLQIPPWYQRQWLQLSITTIYVPMFIKRIVNNRDSIWKFVSTGTWEFLSGLWKNWILTPMLQIWDTIRFDSGEMYVTSRDNLTSELNSLIRMIVEFLRDRCKDPTNFDVDRISGQIINGDLHEFMSIYESQLETPVKSVIFDNMIRSFLIQLQKVKVDGSMAMNGINKLLKSQQLLFSLVSLLPALLICYGIYNSLMVSVNSSVSWAKDIEGQKFRIKRSLHEIERLLNDDILLEKENVEECPDEKLKSVALLNLEIAMVRMLMVRYLPKNYRKIWIRDCNSLADHHATRDMKLNTMNRIYHMYGRYL